MHAHIVALYAVSIRPYIMLTSVSRLRIDTGSKSSSFWYPTKIVNKHDKDRIQTVFSKHSYDI